MLDGLRALAFLSVFFSHVFHHALPGVVGVGITKVGEDYALKVNLREPLPQGVSVPERIGDVPVRVEVVGRITKRG